jgi:3-methyladenine DNA glycosylase AlkD
VTTAEVIRRLKAASNPANVAGMARYGIIVQGALGIPIPFLRVLAKEIGTDHKLALGLWASGIHEARILASLVDAPEHVTASQLERWVKDFDSWDVCDQVCSNLFDKTPWAHQKAIEWSTRRETFVKRAGFVLMAALSVHDKKANDRAFLRFLPIIRREALDDRNFVKKAVNWALRQIGKRNQALNAAAIRTAKAIARLDSRSARWIASDALRELRSEAVRKRVSIVAR